MVRVHLGAQYTIMDILKIFRPSIKDIIYRAILSARGICLYRINPIPQCYICGRQEDSIFRFTRLIYYYDASLEALVAICDDHGKVTDYDCITGEKIYLPLPRPYWYRHIRNNIQTIILWMTIAARFVWFALYNMIMWYIVVYPYWWYKTVTQKCKQ